MNFLDWIPEDLMITIGTIAGLFACATISVQVVKEWRTKALSSLAIAYVAGWLVIFFFWMLYGIRFRQIALWLPNIIAVVLQSTLLVCILRKRALDACEEPAEE
jgi:uncharacterized protein with PQ loop repeat